MERRRIAAPSFFASIFLVSIAAAAEVELAEIDVSSMMRMDVTVTSAAKHAQSSGDAAAAVFVVTRDEIERSGATSIPELLRGVPGIQVARVANNRWAVTARGFTSHYANKLLVMIDGRSIYTPLFGGVLWEEQHVPLELIDRIEVVRGPGGALWGANAVNGIINIVTRPASESRGLRIAAGTGNEERAAGYVSFGDSIGRDNDYRLYVEHFQREPFEGSGEPWELLQAGARLDGALGGGRYVLQANAAENDLGEYVRGGVRFAPMSVDSGDLLAAWRGGSFGGGQLDVQGSFAWRDAFKFGRDAEEHTDLDLSLQQSFPRWQRHTLSVGAQTRRFTDRLRENPGEFEFVPQRARQDSWSIYAQDEIGFRDDDLRFTLGAKYESFEFTSAKLQPTVRALWHASEEHTLWAAASRAVRTPSRFERSGAIHMFDVPGEPPLRFVLFGNGALEAERMSAYELGWRWRPRQLLSVELALFSNEYTGLVQTRRLTPVFDPGPPPLLVAPIQFINGAGASVRGIEINSDWIVNDVLRLQASATTMDVDTQPSGSGADVCISADAEQAASIRAKLDLPGRVGLDFFWRWVSAIPTCGADAYASVNARIGWRYGKRLELSLAVENLLDEEHVEYYDEELLRPGDVLDRNVFARAIWRPAL